MWIMMNPYGFSFSVLLIQLKGTIRWQVWLVIAQPCYPGKHWGTSPLYVKSHFAPSEWPSLESLGIQRSEFQKTKEIPLVFTLRY